MRTPTYSREQVLELERHAWTESDNCRFFFNGIDFCLEAQQARSELPATWHVIAVEEAPAIGWSHAEDCNCPLCRERGRSDS